MIGAVRVLADEGEKAAPIIAPLLDFLPVALNSPVPSLPFHFFIQKSPTKWYHFGLFSPFEVYAYLLRPGR